MSLELSIFIPCGTKKLFLNMTGMLGGGVGGGDGCGRGGDSGGGGNGISPREHFYIGFVSEKGKKWKKLKNNAKTMCFYSFLHFVYTFSAFSH